MKLIYAGPSGPASLTFGNYLFNCRRNKQCQKTYFVPVDNLQRAFFYADLPGKPLTYEATLMDLCNLDCTGAPGDFNEDYNFDYLTGEGCKPTETATVWNSYVIGQKPNNSWYGVFGAPTVDALPDFFFFRFTFTIDGVEYVYYTEMFEKEKCEPLTFVRGCYPNEDPPANATDCNGVYYGFPSTNDFLGAKNLRYFHWAYVRKGSVIDSKETLALTFFNSKKTYKSIITREKTLEFELVPPFYKDVLIGIFARGNIQVNGSNYRLADGQNFQVLSIDSKLWQLDAVLTEEDRNFFGCNPSDCTLPDIPPGPVDACEGNPDDVSTSVGTDCTQYQFETFPPAGTPWTVSGIYCDGTGTLYYAQGVVGGSIVNPPCLVAGSLVLTGNIRIASQAPCVGTGGGGATTLALTGGVFNAGDRIEWEVKEGPFLHWSGVIDQLPLKFVISDPAFDLSTHCYFVRWRKHCANGIISGWHSKYVGNCAPVGACKTYNIEYTGHDLTKATITYVDCNGVNQSFEMLVGTSTVICAQEGTVLSNDAGGTTLDVTADGCHPPVTPVCYSYKIVPSGGGGTLVHWTDCATGDPLQTYISEAQFFCSRDLPYTDASDAAITQEGVCLG